MSENLDFIREIVDTDVKNAPLKAFDVTDVPDIGYRDISHCQASETVYDVDALALGETAAQDVKNVKSRFRQAKSSNSYLLPIYQDFYDSYQEATAAGLAPGRIHNVLEYCPPNHPDCEASWFSDGGNQLCYTARGDEDSRQRLVEYCAAKICNSLEIWPRASAPLMNKVTITIEDYTTHCNCNTCAQQMKVDDNSRCGAIIRFCNDVREIVDDLNSDCRDVIVRVQQQPTVTNGEICDNNINVYVIVELLAEVIGETKIKVSIFDQYDPCDPYEEEDFENQINEDFIRE